MTAALCSSPSLHQVWLLSVAPPICPSLRVPRVLQHPVCFEGGVVLALWPHLPVCDPFFLLVLQLGGRGQLPVLLGLCGLSAGASASFRFPAPLALTCQSTLTLLPRGAFASSRMWLCSTQAFSLPTACTL